MLPVGVPLTDSCWHEQLAVMGATQRIPSHHSCKYSCAGHVTAHTPNTNSSVVGSTRVHRAAVGQTTAAICTRSSACYLWLGPYLTDIYLVMCQFLPSCSRLTKLNFRSKSHLFWEPKMAQDKEANILT